jgi:protein TonB
MTARAVALLEHNDRPAFARWSVAAAVVLAAHVGLMASYVMLHQQESPGGSPAPAVIMIDLAPLAVAPASPMDADPGPQSQEAQPLPEPQVKEPPPPEPVIEPPPPAQSSVVVAPEPPVTPEVKPKPKTVPPPEPTKGEREKVVTRATAPQRSERDAERAAAPKFGNEAARAALADWRSLVVSKLQAAKRYPSGTSAQGTATITFTLGRNGSVLGRSLIRSSGSSELDQEALVMITRAAPFPPFPASMPQASTSLTAPVRFTLR